MRKIVLLAWLLAPALHAQLLTPVDMQNCVWRNGDNAGWADAGLDEDGWQPTAQWQLDPKQPFLWVRCHANAAGLGGNVSPAVQLSFPAAWTLYANGVPIGTSGDLSSGYFPTFAIRTFSIPPPLTGGPLVLALRFVIRDAFAEALPQPTIGPASALNEHRDVLILAGIRSFAFSFTCYAAICVVGFVLFGLWIIDRERRELLFLGLYCIASFLERLCQLPQIAHFGWPGRLWWAAFVASDLGYLFVILFVVSLTRRRVPVWLWVLLACDYSPDPATLISLFLPPGPSLQIQYFCRFTLYPWITPLTIAILAAALAVAFLPFRRLAPRMRLLAVLSTLWIAADSLWFLVAITARRLAGLPNLYNQWQSFLINARALTTFALLTVLMTLLFREQRRNTVERAAFAAELEAARVVQQVLIPEEIPNVPGFRIESIYKPAGQVGGDFFQILPTTKGGVLIVIGDVSGKGMPAAMTVSLLVGTIRTLAHYTQSPAEILAAMNQRMLGRSRGGFTTCLALHVTGDGELFAANAGHLAPYRNGEELPIESGLPLGLSAGSAYAVAKFRLDPGSRFTLLTDGVVEARKPSGELFGFERTAAIASEPAERIVQAAQAFGQEDDITVLTVAFAGAGVAHA